MLRSLVLAFIITAHLFFVLLPPHPTVLSLDEVETYRSRLAQGLELQGIRLAEEEVEDLVSEATIISKRLFGNDALRSADFAAKLLDLYLLTATEDVIIISSPGGWGKIPVADGEWKSVVEGMQTTLGALGYSPVWLDLVRTGNSVSDLLDEMSEVFTSYSLKGRELAALADFLTSHNPQLRVIITGLSQGASHVDRALRYLKKNPRVFGIVGGPPFFQPSLESEQTLVLRSNGEVPDSWSQGPRRIIMQAFGAAPLKWLASGLKGKIANYIKTPGHMYEWTYPEVRAEIVQFLSTHFEGTTRAGAG